MTRHITRRRLLAAGTALTAALTAPVAAPAAAAAAGRPGQRFPDTIALPDGFRPEGIATGSAPFAWFGSLGSGAIYRACLATGEGRIISEGPGTPSVGLKADRRGRLFVAGGSGGDARVVDGRDGRVLASYRCATGESFVNDVVLTPDAAWFTDSFNPVLYCLPLGPRGQLPAEVVRLPLGGQWVQRQAEYNANGVERTPDGTALLVVQPGGLFRVDPRTGHARQVDLGPVTLPNGDGLLLLGRTLYVVQQRQNAVDVLRLDRAGTRGEAVARITDPRFDIPTTVAVFGDRLYLPNARFTTTPEPTTRYTAVAVPLPVRGG
ncbi:hypothetical protein GCM10027168_62550 [Streptomyces capparidis]